MERLIRSVDKDNIYVTSKCGTIEFTTDGEELWVKVVK
jgi:hypothetical protein